MILFVSDLDGTLIDSALTIPEDSAAGIREAIGRGHGFAAATARTPATVGQILEPVPDALPAIVMNGAGIFDFSREKYLCLHTLSDEKAAAVGRILEETGIGGFLYTVRGCHLDVYYDRIDNLSQAMFKEARLGKPYKTFIQGRAPETAQRVFYCIIDSEKRTGILADALLRIPGIRFFRYQDVHAPECWYVEIYDESASKAAGVRFLREYSGCEKVVCFGDNLNDLPLFEEADESYAVAGAVDALKKAAWGVLTETDTGAVGRFIGNYEK